jgi:hypothetical protein
LYAWIPIAGSSATATSMNRRDKRVTSQAPTLWRWPVGGNDAELISIRRRSAIGGVRDDRRDANV